MSADAGKPRPSITVTPPEPRTQAKAEDRPSEEEVIYIGEARASHGEAQSSDAVKPANATASQHDDAASEPGEQTLADLDVTDVPQRKAQVIVLVSLAVFVVAFVVYWVFLR